MTALLSACPIKDWVKNNWLFISFLCVWVAIFLSHSNQELFLYINRQHTLVPTSIWEFFNLISYSKYFILTSLLLLITFVKRRDKLANIILLIISYYLVFAVLKKVVGEARPYIVLPSDSFFWLNHYEDTLKSAYKSFPSGHTGNMAIFAFALSQLFFSKHSGLQLLMLVLVIVVASARICTGWHWPLDVIASGLISYILVKICLSINLSCWCSTKKCV